MGVVYRINEVLGYKGKRLIAWEVWTKRVVKEKAKDRDRDRWCQWQQLWLRLPLPLPQCRH